MSEQQNPQDPVPAQPAPDPSLQPPPPPYDPATPPPPVWTPPPATPPPDSMWNRVAAFLVLIAVVAAAGGAGIGWSLARAVGSHQVAQSSAQPSTQPESPITQVTPSPEQSTGAANTEAIANKVRPAIVDINTFLGNGEAAGTGMIISSTGEILTNNHVVKGSTSISVSIQGRSGDYSAHVVGVNVAQDVAVIQIDDRISGLPTVTFANSSSVQVGDTVVAIGNALGRGGAPANRGHVTALDQTITTSEGRGDSETLSGMIQSDALIYAGDSGGALVNTSSQVVGMITAGQAEGFRSAASDVGFAISSNNAVQQVNRIRAHDQGTDLAYGKVGYLGVSVQDASTSGALVVGVEDGSPAADAGITAGSVITGIGGTAVTSSDSLGAAIKAHRAGEKVSVTWTTPSGTTRSATVTLGGVNP